MTIFFRLFIIFNFIDYLRGSDIFSESSQSDRLKIFDIPDISNVLDYSEFSSSSDLDSWEFNDKVEPLDLELQLINALASGSFEQDLNDSDNIKSLKRQRYYDDFLETEYYTDYTKVNQYDPINNVSSEMVDSLKINQQCILDRLIKLFNSQFPRFKYNSNNFFIENWPSDVDLLRINYWTFEDMEKINKNFHLFRFKDKNSIFSSNQDELKLEKMECLTSAILDTTVSKAYALRIIYDRYSENRVKKSPYFRIDWKLLDRRGIPEKYNQVPLNGTTFSYSYLIYQNREILDNIRFYPDSPTNPIDNIENDAKSNINNQDLIIEVGCAESITRTEVLAKLLKRFKEETRLRYATKIRWSLLDNRLIPDEFKCIELRSQTMSLANIFRNRDIVNNIHFFKPGYEIQQPKKPKYS